MPLQVSLPMFSHESLLGALFARAMPDVSVLINWKFPNLVVSNLVVYNFRFEALFCAHLRPFALFCALLHSLRPFAYWRLRSLLRSLEQPRLGISESDLQTVVSQQWFDFCGVIKMPLLTSNLIWTPSYLSLTWIKPLLDPDLASFKPLLCREFPMGSQRPLPSERSPNL